MVNEGHPCLYSIELSLMSLFDIDLKFNRYWLFFHYSFECPIILKYYGCECPIIPRIMLVKLVTYNSQNYAGTLGLGLQLTVCMRWCYEPVNLIMMAETSSKQQ